MTVKNKFKEDMHFQVSVIMPVYKAENFVKKAVLSAVGLKEVGEIILIEDGSPDNSLNICEELVKEFKKVKLLRHINGANKGAGASRNLGIKYATCNYISFLDADDWYLPIRFLKDAEVFKRYSRADAVYSSSIVEEYIGDFSKRYGAKNDLRKEIGYNANPKEFYKKILQNEQVIFNTNSITLKKCFLLKYKLFDERLRLHQDTELWDRLIRGGNFFASEIEKPVAVIRRHMDNRITSRNSKSQLKMLGVFIENVGVQNLYNFEKVNLLKTIIRHKSKSFPGKWKRRLYYYSRFLLWSFHKDDFLNKFHKNIVND